MTPKQKAALTTAALVVVAFGPPIAAFIYTIVSQWPRIAQSQAKDLLTGFITAAAMVAVVWIWMFSVQRLARCRHKYTSPNPTPNPFDSQPYKCTRCEETLRTGPIEIEQWEIHEGRWFHRCQGQQRWWLAIGQRSIESKPQ